MTGAVADRRTYIWSLTGVTKGGPNDVYSYEYEYQNGDKKHISFYEHPDMLGYYVLVTGKEFGIHAHLLTSSFMNARLNKADVSKLTVIKAPGMGGDRG